MSNIDEDAFGSMAGALSKYGKGVGADPKKPRRATLGGQTMTGHTEKKVGSGTVYQKKLTHYGDYQEKPVVEKPEGEVKRGRGRPPGKHGSYKARTGDAAATAAKAAATKAANKAARNESMTEDDFSDICEMHELESFDDLLEFALELDEMQLDELSKATLGSYIKKATDKRHNYDAYASDQLRTSHFAGKELEGSDKRTVRAKSLTKDKESYNAIGAAAHQKANDIAANIKKARAKLKLTKESTEMTREDFEDLIESYEQLDELSKATLGSYIKKATDKRHNYDAYASDQLRTSHFAGKELEGSDKRTVRAKSLTKDKESYNAIGAAAHQKANDIAANIKKARAKLKGDKYRTLVHNTVDGHHYLMPKSGHPAHPEGAVLKPKAVKEDVQSLIDAYLELDESDRMDVLDALSESDCDARIDESEEISESMSAYVDGMKRLLPDF